MIDVFSPDPPEIKALATCCCEQVPLACRKALWCESQALLSYLYDHIKQPEFSCRVRWQEGSLAMRDNRSTWHLALNDYSGESRLMHRVTIAGEALN
jgi:hypothetical protein